MIRDIEGSARDSFAMLLAKLGYVFLLQGKLASQLATVFDDCWSAVVCDWVEWIGTFDC